jgi:hypothetical protein
MWRGRRRRRWWCVMVVGLLEAARGDAAAGEKAGTGTTKESSNTSNTNSPTGCHAGPRILIGVVCARACACVCIGAEAARLGAANGDDECGDDDDVEERGVVRRSAGVLVDLCCLVIGRGVCERQSACVRACVQKQPTTQAHLETNKQQKGVRVCCERQPVVVEGTSPHYILFIFSASCVCVECV